MSVTYMWKFQIVLGQWSYTESGSCKKPLDAVAFRIQLAASSEHLDISASVYTFVQNSTVTHHAWLHSKSLEPPMYP